MNLFLASVSPRRRELLNQLGVPFRLLNIAIDEQPKETEPPNNYVERMAKEKAESGLASLASTDSSLVLAADTIVVLGDKILGKPQSREEAKSMLKQLSGRSHTVMTAFALKTNDKTRLQRVNTTGFFRPILEREYDWYWQTGEQQDKAGGYAIQGLGGAFVSSITGSFSSVVGLPLAELISALREFGVDMAQGQ